MQFCDFDLPVIVGSDFATLISQHCSIGVLSGRGVGTEDRGVVRGGLWNRTGRGKEEKRTKTYHNHDTTADVL